MGLERATLAKADQRLRAELDHGDGVQLVKVPVSDAVWATWRRYCEVVGVTMGQGISVLLQNELSKIADVDVLGLVDRLKTEEAELRDRTEKLEESERANAKKANDLATLDQELRIRERALAQRTRGLTGTDQRGTGADRGRKLGRNELCWCGSEKKYKVCHLPYDG